MLLGKLSLKSLLLFCFIHTVLLFVTHVPIFPSRHHKCLYKSKIIRSVHKTVSRPLITDHSNILFAIVKCELIDLSKTDCERDVSDRASFRNGTVHGQRIRIVRSFTGSRSASNWARPSRLQVVIATERRGRTPLGFCKVCVSLCVLSPATRRGKSATNADQKWGDVFRATFLNLQT